MKNLKEILERDFKGSKYNLSADEQAQIWDSLERRLPVRTGIATKRLYWSFAAVAAIILGVFILRQNVLTPLQPKKPMMATTSGVETFVESRGEKESVEGEEFIEIIEEKEYIEKTIKQRYIAQIYNAEEVSVEVEEGEKEAITIVEPDIKESEIQSSKDDKKEPENIDSSINKESEKGKKSTSKKLYSLDIDENGGGFSLSASSNFSKRGKLNVSSNNFIKSVASKVGFSSNSHSLEIEQISETTYSIPLNFTLQLSYSITSKWGVSTGLSYTYLHSKYNGLIDKRPYKIKQGLHYIGIPVNVYYTPFNFNKFNIYFTAGGMVEKGVRAIYQMYTYDGSRQTANTKIDGVQFSTNLGAGLEYRLGGSNKVGIYIEPNVVYFFDSEVPASIRTSQPLQIEGQIGIRIHLD